MAEEQRKPKTPEDQRTVTLTWFGEILFRNRILKWGSPRGFPPQSWLMTISPRCTYRTWFGTILYYTGIPRRFFPQPWRCNKVKL
jgi:hypothetical protein